MNDSLNIWWAIAGAGAVTYASRGFGVLLSGRLNTDGLAFRWVAAVAYALLAALIARLIVVPLGPLQTTSLPDRLVSARPALAGHLPSQNKPMLGVGNRGGGAPPP